MQQPSGGKQTFEVLNGLRGVAAIPVASMHLSFYMSFIHPANVAPAVDFFFVLSGFVIAYARDLTRRITRTTPNTDWLAGVGAAR